MQHRWIVYHHLWSDTRWTLLKPASKTFNYSIAFYYVLTVLVIINLLSEDGEVSERLRMTRNVANHFRYPNDDSAKTELYCKREIHPEKTLSVKGLAT